MSFEQTDTENERQTRPGEKFLSLHYPLIDRSVSQKSLSFSGQWAVSTSQNYWMIYCILRTIEWFIVIREFVNDEDSNVVEHILYGNKIDQQKYYIWLFT